MATTQMPCIVLTRSVPAQLLTFCLLVTALYTVSSSRRVKSSIDFHFDIVRSVPKTLSNGRTQKVKLRQKKVFLNGSLDTDRDDEFENRPDNKRDCQVVPDCDDVIDSPYRTADGSCNHFRQPDLGSAFQPYKRHVRPQYEDGINLPRIRGKDGSLLPSAREVSRLFHSSDDNVSEDPGITHMVMQWGQFLDHDISITPVQANVDENDTVSGISCCDEAMPENPYMTDIYSVDEYENCFPIPIPADDPVFANINCMAFSRSVQVRNANCRVSPAEQVNQITAFIDASNVYGSSDDEMDALRTFEGGCLKCQSVQSGSGCPASDMLPYSSASCGATQCFKAGDVRVNEQIGLASMHTLFVREHNRIAEKLAEINPSWSDTTLFQETRKIVGAMMQIITYNEFLPIVLGTGMHNYQLTLGNARRKRSTPDSFRSKRAAPKRGRKPNSMPEDPTADPTVKNVFATAAFRFGHSQIRSVTTKRYLNYCCYNTTKLRDVFGDTESLMSDTCLAGAWIRGLVHDKCARSDRYMSVEVTEHLFEDAAGNSLDLAALNIQRGRDHGLPGYNRWRQFCNLKKFNKFSKMTEHTQEERNILAQLYRHPDDIDLFTAGVSERPVDGGLVGETFSCLLGKQFKDLKEGDRFWFETDEEKYGFTSDQLRELRKVTLARIICRNTDTVTIQAQCMKMADAAENSLQYCETLCEGEMDLEAWRESD